MSMTNGKQATIKTLYPGGKIGIGEHAATGWGRDAQAEEKVQAKRLTDGSITHSFQSLLRNLATIVRNTCQSRYAEGGMPSFTIDTQLTQKHQEAFRLLKEIKM